MHDVMFSRKYIEALHFLHLLLPFRINHRTLDAHAYCTCTKFRGLNFRVAISNSICGSLFSWGVNFRGRTPNFVLKRFYQVPCIL